MTPYEQVPAIDAPIPADRQGAKRHYGVHPYFTRRPFNVVRRYIEHYSREGDCVLDPFGGSGVTAIEAFLSNRVGIQNDINPLANFIAQGIADLSKGNIAAYRAALSKVRDRRNIHRRQYRVVTTRRLNSAPAHTGDMLGCPLYKKVKIPRLQ